MNIEVKIISDSGYVQIYDVTGSVHFNCILDAHYDSNGHLDGGLIIREGVDCGHIDPRGEPGEPGEPGETGFNG